MINNSCESSPVDSHVVSPFLWPHNMKLGASLCTNRFACACKLSVFSYTFLEIEIFNQSTYEYLIPMKIGFFFQKVNVSYIQNTLTWLFLHIPTNTKYSGISLPIWKEQRAFFFKYACSWVWLLLDGFLICCWWVTCFTHSHPIEQIKTTFPSMHCFQGFLWLSVYNRVERCLVDFFFS